MSASNPGVASPKGSYIRSHETENPRDCSANPKSACGARRWHRSFFLPCPLCLSLSPSVCVHPSLPAPVPVLGCKMKAAASPGSAVLTALNIWLLGRFPFFFCWHRGGSRPAALPPCRQPSGPRNALHPLGISFQGKALRSCLCGRYSRVSVSLLPFEVWCYLQASEAGSAFMLGAVPR